MTVMTQSGLPVNRDSGRTDVPYGCLRATSSSLGIHGQDCDSVSTKSEHAGGEPRHRRHQVLQGSQQGLGSQVIRPTIPVRRIRVTYPRTFRGPVWSVARDVDVKLNFVSVRIENVHAPGKATVRLVQDRGPRLIEQTSCQAELLQ